MSESVRCSGCGAVVWSPGTTCPGCGERLEPPSIGVGRTAAAIALLFVAFFCAVYGATALCLAPLFLLGPDSGGSGAFALGGLGLMATGAVLCGVAVRLLTRRRESADG